MRVKPEGVIAILIPLIGLIILSVMLMAGGPPPCEPFALYERNTTSMNLFPEKITSRQGERVILLDCNEIVHVKREVFEVYQPKR